MIVWIGRIVVHGKGWYEEATGRIVVQDMLSEGSGEQIMWPENGGGKNHIPCGGGLERWVHGWYWRGEAPSSVRHILVSWRWRLLVLVGFPLHPAPCDIDGPARSARWPFSRLGFRDVRGL